ncbi:hypothetical protein NEPAR04_0847 [Nematocida parisii]|nr:hypothetical protein NEPAR08_0849 [Nematocida parisii]KAI5129017.1 hypothetical protein NEPAR03_1463 [Nematocida parisii]KAI5141285.1 hypothetical protein NEPAR04_0847 [Nematocida parisii]
MSDVLTKSNTIILPRSPDREVGEWEELFIVSRKRLKPAWARSIMGTRVLDLVLNLAVNTSQSFPLNLGKVVWLKTVRS